MLSFFALLISAAVLYFILRYRVHIHITATVPGTLPPSKRSKTPMRLDTCPKSATSTIQADLISALRNQGCSAAVARRAVQRTGNIGTFDEQLRRAINFAWGAA
jgi:hypothetical protein